MTDPKPALMRYVVAILVTILAFAVSLAFQPLLSRISFTLFVVAVLISAWYGGVGPAILATVLSAMSGAFFVIPPAGSFDLAAEDWMRLGAFLLISVLTILITASRERANRNLARESERLRVTLASIGDAVIVASPEGKVVFMNGVAQSLTAWNEADAAGKHLTEVFKIVNEQTRAEVEGPVTRVLRDGVIAGLGNHTLLIARNGREIPIDDSAAPIRDTQGKATGVVLIFRDITERRKTEQALRASEERFRALTENSSDAVALIDAQGLVRYASPSTARVLGYQVDEYVGRNLFDLVHPDDAGWISERFRGLRQTSGQSFDGQFRYRHKNGEWRWIEGVITNLLEQTSVGAIVANYRDITERRLAEEEIRRSRDQLDIILHGITDGITVQAPSGELLYANDAAARTIGFTSADEVVKTPVSQIMTRFRVADESGEPFPLENLPGRIALQGRPAGPTPVRFTVVATGEDQWSQVEARPVFDSEGKVQFAINIFHDITASKRAEQRLEAESATSRILAEAANLDEATPQLLEALCETLGWSTGAIWRVDIEANVLRFVQNWHGPRVQLGEFESASRRVEFAPGIGLPGRVWAQAAPAWIPDVTQDDNFPRASEAKGAGLHGAFAFPIMLGPQVLGVVEFFSVEPRQPNPELLALASTIGGQIGQFLERKRAEEALRDSEERIRTIAETASDGIITIDSDSRILFLNQAVGRMFGYASEELIGSSLTRLMPPDQRELHENSIKRYIHTQQKRVDWQRVGFPGQRKDGTTFPLEISLGEFARGGKRFFTGIVRDVTERRRTEERLSFQANVLENVRDAVVAINLQGNILYWNQGAAQLFGYPSSEMIGTPITRLYPDPREEHYSSELEQVLKQEVWTHEEQRRRKDGSLAWFDLKSAAMHDASGQILGMLTVAKDITEQRESERALRESEERFRSLTANAPMGIFLADIAGRTTYMNPALLSMGRSGVDTTPSRGWEQWVYPDDRASVLEQWRSYTREGAPFAREYRMRTMQGETRWVSVRASPILGDGGKLIGHVGTIQDITERKQAGDALQFLAEASGLLASSLDYETTLKSVAHLAVPRVADWCIVDIMGEDGELHGLEIAHKDPDKIRWGWELRKRYPIDINAPTGAPNVVRTGQAEVIPEITDEMLVTAAQTPEDLEIYRRIGLSSLMYVPLNARGKTLGVIELVNTESARRFGPADLALAEELARRAAVAVDNARLYKAEQEARRAAEHAAGRTERLQAVTAALSEAVTPEQVATVVVDQGVAALGASAGYMTLLSEDGAWLHVVRSIGYPPEVREGVTGVAVGLSVPSADAFRLGEPIWLDSPEERQRRYPQLGPGHFSSAYSAYVAIPLLAEGRTLGVMGLSFAEWHQLSGEDRNFILTLAQQTSQALERARLFEGEQRAHAQAERAKERLSFLAEASKLWSSSLDFDFIVQSMAELAVPRLADWCTVHVLEGDGSVRMAAGAHAEPAKVELIRELNARFPLSPDTPFDYPRVIRSGESIFLPEPTLADIELIAPDEEQRALLRQLGFSSHLCVPLAARGLTFGAVTLNLAQAGRCFVADDLAQAEEFARRAALALDNARLYGQAQEAIGLRDQFLSIASHELKTPLTSLTGYAELLQRNAEHDGALEERDRRAVQVIAASSSRLNKLINTMLDVSRIETGQLTIERGPVDLRALGQRVVEEARLTAERHQLEFVAPNRPLVVEGDELRLDQVLQNLLQNAIKYSPHGGLVRVELASRGENACIAVQDEGLGIPASEMPNLFSRFYRVQSGMTRHISGMGVGLYVVKQIVNLHGGTITVESREGVGSTFTVCLPLAKEKK